MARTIHSGPKRPSTPRGRRRNGELGPGNASSGQRRYLIETAHVPVDDQSVGGREAYGLRGVRARHADCKSVALLSIFRRGGGGAARRFGVGWQVVAPRRVLDLSAFLRWRATPSQL